MSFKDGGWGQRVGALGDEAEAVFDAIFPAHHKSGINRPPMQVSKIDVVLRNMPDRMVYDRFVEVLGFGRQQEIKFKLEKFQAQMKWAGFMPVDLFLYDSKFKRYWIAPIEEWWFAACRDGYYGRFENDGNEYLALAVSNFPVEPIPVPDGGAKREVVPS